MRHYRAKVFITEYLVWNLFCKTNINSSVYPTAIKIVRSKNKINSLKYWYSTISKLDQKFNRVTFHSLSLSFLHPLSTWNSSSTPSRWETFRAWHLRHFRSQAESKISRWNIVCDIEFFNLHSRTPNTHQFAHRRKSSSKRVSSGLEKLKENRERESHSSSRRRHDSISDTINGLALLFSLALTHTLASTRWHHQLALDIDAYTMRTNPRTLYIYTFFNFLRGCENTSLPMASSIVYIRAQQVVQKRR